LSSSCFGTAIKLSEGQTRGPKNKSGYSDNVAEFHFCPSSVVKPRQALRPRRPIPRFLTWFRTLRFGRFQHIHFHQLLLASCISRLLEETQDRFSK
jgi:hypothetical protein